MSDNSVSRFAKYEIIILFGREFKSPQIITGILSCVFHYFKSSGTKSHRFLVLRGGSKIRISGNAFLESPESSICFVISAIRWIDCFNFQSPLYGLKAKWVVATISLFPVGLCFNTATTPIWPVLQCSWWYIWTISELTTENKDRSTARRLPSGNGSRFLPKIGMSKVIQIITRLDFCRRFQLKYLVFQSMYWFETPSHKLFHNFCSSEMVRYKPQNVQLGLLGDNKYLIATIPNLFVSDPIFI